MASPATLVRRCSSYALAHRSAYTDVVLPRTRHLRHRHDDEPAVRRTSGASSDPPSGRKRLVAQTVPSGSHGASASRASRVVGWPIRSRASKIDFDSVSITLQTATKSEQEPTSAHEIKSATQPGLPPFSFPQPSLGAV